MKIGEPINFREYPRMPLPIMMYAAVCAVGSVAGGLAGVRLSSVFDSQLVAGTLGILAGAYLSGLAYQLGNYWRVAHLLPVPACRSGACHKVNREYTYWCDTSYGWSAPGVYYFQCLCGDEYVRVGKRFMRVDEDGSARAYKRMVQWDTWVDDEALASDPPKWTAVKATLRM